MQGMKVGSMMVHEWEDDFGQSLDICVSNLIAVSVECWSRKVKVEIQFLQVGKVCSGKQLSEFGDWCPQSQIAEVPLESGPCVAQECLGILSQR